MEALAAANEGYARAYCEDRYSKQAKEDFRRVFGCDLDLFFVFNGTGANCTSLCLLSQCFNSVVCSDVAHIYIDESVAPETMAGIRLTPLKSKDGKITAEQVEACFASFKGVQHRTQPKVVSLTQPTELGTLYTCDEIRDIATVAHKYGGFVQLDGARIANAAAAMGLSYREITCDLGVDIMSFGGTKNGMMMGEAILVFDQRCESRNFPYVRKSLGQLFSKMRYVGAQFSAFLKDDLGISLANHANQMAKYLTEQIAEHAPSIKLAYKVESNAVFVVMPPKVAEKMLEKHSFYIWNEETNVVRLMCSFSIEKEFVDEFVADLKQAIEQCK